MQKVKENLVFLLDLNSSYYLSSDKPSEILEKMSLEELITSIELFSNSFLCCSCDNNFILYVYDSISVTLLFPLNDEDLLLKEKMAYDELNKAIVNRLIATIQSKKPDVKRESKLASALSKGLLYLNKISGEKSSFKNRIVLVSCSDVLDQDYINLINCAFAAQTKKFLIDAIALQKESIYLKQICHITKGTYSCLKPPKNLEKTIDTRASVEHNHLKNFLKFIF